ncbi:unnamed protein product [Caenorhabditis brenneri]
MNFDRNDQFQKQLGIRCAFNSALSPDIALMLVQNTFPLVTIEEINEYYEVLTNELRESSQNESNQSDISPVKRMKMNPESPEMSEGDRKCLIEAVPPEMLNLILEKSSTKEQEALQKSSFVLSSFISNNFQTYREVEIYVTKEAIHMKVEKQKPRVMNPSQIGIKRKFSAANTSEKIDSTTCSPATLPETLQILKAIFKPKNVKITSLKIHYEENKQFYERKAEFMTGFQSMLNELNHDLHVENLTIVIDNSDRLLSVLDKLKPGSLRTIDFTKTDDVPQREFVMANIVTSEHWKHISKFIGMRFELDLRLDQVIHIPVFIATISQLSIEEVLNYKNKLIQTPPAKLSQYFIFDELEGLLEALKPFTPATVTDFTQIAIIVGSVGTPNRSFSVISRQITNVIYDVLSATMNQIRNMLFDSNDELQKQLCIRSAFTSALPPHAALLHVQNSFPSVTLREIEEMYESLTTGLGNNFENESNQSNVASSHVSPALNSKSPESCVEKWKISFEAFPPELLYSILENSSTRELETLHKSSFFLSSFIYNNFITYREIRFRLTEEAVYLTVEKQERRVMRQTGSGRKFSADDTIEKIDSKTHASATISKILEILKDILGPKTVKITTLIIYDETLSISHQRTIDFMTGFQNILNELNHNLHVEELRISIDSADELLSILNNLKPGSLKTVQLSWITGPRRLDFANIVKSQHWKHIFKFTSVGNTLDLHMDQITHIPAFVGSLIQQSSENVLIYKNKLVQSPPESLLHTIHMANGEVLDVFKPFESLSPNKQKGSILCNDNRRIQLEVSELYWYTLNCSL